MGFRREHLTSRESDTERGAVSARLDVWIDRELLGVFLTTLEEELYGGLITVLCREMKGSPTLKQGARVS